MVVNWLDALDINVSDHLEKEGEREEKEGGREEKELVSRLHFTLLQTCGSLNTNQE